MMIPAPDAAKQAADLPTVVIVGAGFGGLRAAHALRRVPVRVLMIDRHNYHLFQPLLYQIASAGLEPSDIARPIRAIFRHQARFDFLMAELTTIDPASHAIVTNLGPVHYDFLILSLGGETNYFGLDALRRTTLPLKDADDAVAIRNHVLRCFELAVVESNPELRRALLTFVIVGGGPTGVEMAGALSELTRLVLSRDYPRLDFSEVQIVLLEASDHLLAMFPSKLQTAAERTLRRKHVDVRLRVPVRDYTSGRVTLQDGSTLAAETLIWAAGIQAGTVTSRLALPTARDGRIAVDAHLRVTGHDAIYAIGDNAYLEVDGQRLPMVAPVAIQMADTAAGNIARRLKGKPERPFQYHDPGVLATIGRNAAVAYIHGFAFQGFIAWVVWLALHIVKLIGFRNRLVVLISWAWDYFFYERASRLITKQ